MSSTSHIPQNASFEDILLKALIELYHKNPQAGTHGQPSDEGDTQMGEAAVEPNNPHLKFFLEPQVLKTLERLLLALLNNPALNLGAALLAQIKLEFRFNRLNVAKVVERLVKEATRGNMAAKACVNDLAHSATLELSAVATALAKKAGLELTSPSKTPFSMIPRPKPR